MSRGPVIHRTTFENKYGETPQEMHRRIVFAGLRCAGCGSEKVAAVIKVIVPWAEVPDMVRATVELDCVLRDEPRPTFRTKDGVEMTIASKVPTCGMCRRTAERVAARSAPSYAIVEIDEGPKDQGAVVQVPGWATSGRSVV